MKELNIRTGEGSLISLTGVIHQPELGLLCKLHHSNGKTDEIVIRCNQVYYMAALGLLEFLEKTARAKESILLN